MPLQYRKTLTVSASDADFVAAAQTPIGASNLTLTSPVVTIPNGGQRLSISAIADESLLTFVVTGTDRYGRALTYSRAGPNATTVELPYTWATVTSVHISGAAGDAVTVGIIATADLMPLPLNPNECPFAVSVTGQNITGAGTPAWTVVYTVNDVQDPSLAWSSIVWINHATLVAQTATASGNFAFPVIATGLILDGNDQAATIDFIVLQAVT